MFSVGKPSRNKKGHNKYEDKYTGLHKGNNRFLLYSVFFFFAICLSSTANNQMQRGYSHKKDTFINNFSNNTEENFRLRHCFRACDPMSL